MEVRAWIWWKFESFETSNPALNYSKQRLYKARRHLLRAFFYGTFRCSIFVRFYASIPTSLPHDPCTVLSVLCRSSCVIFRTGISSLWSKQFKWRVLESVFYCWIDTSYNWLGSYKRDFPSNIKKTPYNKSNDGLHVKQAAYSRQADD